MMSGRRILGLLAAVGSMAIILSWGCGLKGKPQPPTRVIPEAPSGLRAEVDAQGVRLSCAVPERNVEGSALTDLEAVEFQRASVGEGDCPTCPMSFNKVGEVPYSYSPGEPMPRGRLSLLDKVGKPGLYRYRAQARNSRGQLSRPSGTIQVYWDMPPARVEGVTATGSDQRVELRWDQVSVAADGGALLPEQVAYQIFRRREGGGFGVAPLNPTPIPQNSYVDVAVQNQTTYAYRVRAVRRVGERFVPGAFSDQVEVIPQRLAPPGPPAGLVGFPTSTGVRLVWEGGPGKGISGYKVYRARAAAGPWELLSPEVVVTPYFDDRGAEQGRTYWYSVSTLDDSTPPMEGDRSAPVRVHMPTVATPQKRPGP